MSEKKPTNRSDKKQKKPRKIRIFRVILLSMILIGLIGAGATAGIVLSVIKDAEPIDPANIYTLLDETSFILDADGQVIEKIQTGDFRTIINYTEMPETLIHAFVSIEDERFWRHKGVDVRRIFGAAWTNLRTGSRQGASTINQQLAVNLYLNRGDRSYTRKIKDAYYGIQLNRHLSKEQILEAYLNTIYLGSGAHGVQAASQVYFSKDVGELTLAESALIAGITRNPSRYSPIRTLQKEHITEDHYILDDSDPVYTIVFNEQTLPRQRLVLSVMKRIGHISEEEYTQALEEDIKSNLRPNRHASEEISSYFGDLVKRDVIKALEAQGYTREVASGMLQSGGLRIYSTMDVRMQKILEEEYEKPANFPGTLKDSEGNLLRDAEGNIQPQSAMVVLDYRTGEIKALVGGRMISGQKIFNRALSPRPPGSAIKPIAVYTPAIDRGFTAASIIDDVPVYFNRNTPNETWPNNWYQERYFGLITMRESIRWSSNVGAVVMANNLAADDRTVFNTMFEYMEKMGISTIVRRSNPVIIGRQRFDDETYSTTLGGMTRGTTPLDITTSYGVLANQGVYVEPITFTKVLDRHGNPLVENKPTRNRVISPQASYIMTDMLKTVVDSGTGSRARLDQGNSKIPVVGKTGTTTEQKDAWFVGYTPYYAAGVWVGNDIPRALSSGSRIATDLWQKVMLRIHENHSPREFEVPENIVRVNICTISGKLATDLCAQDPRGSTVRSEIFIRGTEPTEPCDVHVLADIHKPSGKLATEQTPPWEVESRVFVRRPIPYYPEDHGGIRPRDYIYELPREYYDPLVDGMGGNYFFDGSQDGWIDRRLDEEITEDIIIDSIDLNF